jgi:hypothetical protein
MAKIPGTTRRRRGEILVGLPRIHDDLDPETKNAMALRAAAWVSGTCPSCNVEVMLTPFVELNLIGVSIEHLDGCPVTEVLLDPEDRDRLR